jgi:hypothetical protein
MNATIDAPASVFGAVRQYEARVQAIGSLSERLTKKKKSNIIVRLGMQSMP